MTSSQLASYANDLPKLSVPIAGDAGADKSSIISGGSNSGDTQISVKYGLPYKMSQPLSSNGIAVPRQDLNCAFNITSKLVHFLMAGGTIPWSSDEATAIGGYPTGAKVSYGGSTWTSLDDNNLATPGTDDTKWLTDAVDIFDQMWPKDSIYISLAKDLPAVFQTHGTWVRIASGKCLWGADGTGSNVGKTKTAGLPNIWGVFNGDGTNDFTGAFYKYGKTNFSDGVAGGGSKIGFSASNCSDIYGNSSTVQPPALIVSMWQRKEW